jgi:DUF4097 and DUF4098 domain-containing protein YvlB
MRIRFLIVLLAVLSLSAFADDWNKDYNVGGSPKLNVDTNDAHIRVSAGAGNRISARVTTDGYKIGPTDVRISERQSGDEVTISVRIPSMTFRWGNHNVTVEISVPAATQLYLRSGDGRLEVSGTRAAAKLSTGDGRITVRDFEGPLNAHSGDGRVEVEGRFDDLQLDTSDGSIDAEVRPGSKMTGRWYVHTGDGSVRLRLPDGFGADLDARSGDGRIDVSMPVTMNGSMNRNSVRGKINGGGQTLEIRTGDGSIHIGRF